jgi:hypothetical protein
VPGHQLSTEEARSIIVPQKLAPYFFDSALSEKRTKARLIGSPVAICAKRVQDLRRGSQLATVLITHAKPFTQ